jgi:hypothetical protein
MLRARLVRELTVRREPGAAGPAHVAAASGLALAGDHLYVIADDEAAIGQWRADEPARPGTLLDVFAQVLPADPAERKQHKPDLEALALLPAHAGAPHGALLALGSGSTPERRRGVCVPLAADGSPTSEPRGVELAGLYAALERRLPRLNIEGATVCGDALLLAHRGMGHEGASAIVSLDLAGVLGAGALEGGLVRDVVTHDLGRLDGVALAFTDLCALPDGRILYSAAAEDSADPFHDGATAGSVVGVLGRAAPARVDGAAKVEGVLARAGEGGDVELLLVADPDDRAKPAPLLAATLSGG